MLFYRVHFWVPSAKPGENGHPLYVWPRQGAGRIDNPPHYRTLYVADSPQGAVAETFGNHSVWTPDLYVGLPSLPGSVRAISILEGSPSVLDLDDASTLLDQGLRPSRVVTRNRTHTQAWALGIYTVIGGGGVRWWSYHDPDWGSLGLWDYSSIAVVSTSPLSHKHPAVVSAASVLNRPLG
jgi:hypothetical protein